MTSGSIPVLSKSYIFDPRPHFPLLIVARRYWVGKLHPNVNDQNVFCKTGQDVRTLVFLHGNGCHKEHWELTIQRLFDLQQASTSSDRFRDMWSLDLPNHGDSAVLNEEILHSGYETFPWELLARSVHAFLAGLGTGVDVDFSKRRLSLVGHSIGGSILLIASTYYPRLKISSLHFMESTLLDDRARSLSLSEMVMKSLSFFWPSAEEALQAAKTRQGALNWDERITRIFATHGLRPLPTMEYPEMNEGLTPKCTKKQMAATYRGIPPIGLIYETLPRVLNEIPTHIMFGDLADFIPYEWQQEILHVASGGISNFASVTTVPGVGHMALQTHPELVADIIWKQVDQSCASPQVNSTVAAKL